MFNIQGSEFLFLLVVALIILGPEKLPDAVRKFGRAYAEFKKMANGFQGEIRSALDEPMRELRDTADAMRSAANFDLGGILNGTATDTATDTATNTATNTTEPAATTDAPPAAPAPGLNFGSAIPRRTSPLAQDDTTPAETPADTPGDEATPNDTDAAE